MDVNQKKCQGFCSIGATFMELGIYQLNLVKNAQEIFFAMPGKPVVARVSKE